MKGKPKKGNGIAPGVRSAAEQTGGDALQNSDRSNAADAKEDEGVENIKNANGEAAVQQSTSNSQFLVKEGKEIRYRDPKGKL